MRRNPRVLVASCRADGKLRSEPVPARVEVLTATPDLERVQKLLIERYKISYRLVMLVYRLGRRLRGQRSVADGAALAITVERPDPLLDDGSHTPPHGDALFVRGGGELP